MSEYTHWKTRTLLAYGAVCCIGHLLLLMVYGLYVLFWLLLGEDGAGGMGLLIVGGVAGLAVTVANCCALYAVLQHQDMTRSRLRFLVIFFGALVAVYSLIAAFASQTPLVWCAVTMAVLLLPLPVLLSRPTVLAAIHALPVEEDDFDTDW